MCLCHGFAGFSVTYVLSVENISACLYVHWSLEHTDFTVMMDHEAEYSTCRLLARACHLFIDGISALRWNAERGCH